MAIHSGFMWIYPLVAWWFSTIMLVYQRVPDCSPQDLIWLDPNGFTVVCRDDFSTAASRQLRSTAGSFLCAKPWGQNQAMRETCAGTWDHHGNLTNYPLPSMDNDFFSHAEELVPWPDLVGLAGSLGTLRRLNPLVVAFLVHWWIWCVNVLYPNHPACKVTKLTNCFPF